MSDDEVEFLEVLEVKTWVVRYSDGTKEYFEADGYDNELGIFMALGKQLAFVNTGMVKSVRAEPETANAKRDTSKEGSLMAR
jgi:hypothetical protein